LRVLEAPVRVDEQFVAASVIAIGDQYLH
jgi:hypothetical protein